jgi:hypothetical protein
MSMEMDDPGQVRLRRGTWAAIAVSAAAGVISLISRPDLEPGDLVLPAIVTAVLVAAILVVRYRFPQAVSNPDRNAGFMIGFMVGMVFILVVLQIAGAVR